MTAALTAEMDAWLREAAAIRYTHEMPAKEAMDAFLEWEMCVITAMVIGAKHGLDQEAVMARYDAIREEVGGGE